MLSGELVIETEELMVEVNRVKGILQREIIRLKKEEMSKWGNSNADG